MGRGNFEEAAPIVKYRDYRLCAAAMRPFCPNYFHHLLIFQLQDFSPQIIFFKLECGPMPNVMVPLPNIGGALCSVPQSLLTLTT